MPPHLKLTATFAAVLTLFLPKLLPAAEASASFEEHLVYSLHWGLISVGEAELKTGLKALPSGGEPIPYAQFTVRTSGIADKLFKVRDKIETWSDPESGRPILYLKEQREGKTERDIELHFDWEAQTVEHWRNGERMEPLAIPLEAVDPLSAVFLLRAAELSGEASAQFTATDGKRITQIEVYPEGAATVRTGYGRVASRKYSVATRELEGVFEKSPDASIELWFSDDDRRYPVRLQSEVIVGSFYGSLERVEGVEWDPPRSEFEPARPGGPRRTNSRR